MTTELLSAFEVSLLAAAASIAWLVIGLLAGCGWTGGRAGGSWSAPIWAARC